MIVTLSPDIDQLKAGSGVEESILELAACLTLIIVLIVHSVKFLLE